jgi:four helix bundle protein
MKAQTVGSWDLKDLIAWQVAMDLARDVYAATRDFPADERFGLTLQLRRSAVSIPSNIAEGHGRSGKKEFARFALIARGSLKELETQVLLASRLGFLPATSEARLAATYVRLNELLTGLLRRLRR